MHTKTMHRLLVGVTTAGLVALALVPVESAAASSLPTGTGCAHLVRGDADGDGWSDPIVGVPGKHDFAGQAVVFRGSATGIRPAGLLRAGLAGVPGTDERGAHFGESVVTGDANGDRCSDAAIQTPEASTPRVAAGVDESGSVTVLHGRRDQGITGGKKQLITAASLHLRRPNVRVPAGIRLFRSLGTPVFGDFLGDGHDDLAMVEQVTTSSPDDRRFVDIVVVPGRAGGLALADAIHVQLPSLHTGRGGTFIGGPVTLAAGAVRDSRTDSLAVAVASGAETLTGSAVHGDVSRHPVVDVLNGGSHFPNEAPAQVWDLESPGVPGTDGGGVGDISVAFGDFDADGHADLAFGEPFKNVVTVLRGSGSGLTGKRAQAFSPGRAGLLGSTAHPGHFGRALATGDLNGDGDNELVVGSDDGTIAVIPGTHRGGLTTRGDLRWSQNTPGIPEAREANSAFGASLQVGSYGRGPGLDLLVGDPHAYNDAGSITELFGSTTRTAGLRTDHAALFSESSTGVPGLRIHLDLFGSNTAGWTETG